MKNELSYFKIFHRFDGSLLQVIGDQEFESEVGFLIQPSHWLESRPMKNGLPYFKIFQRFDPTLLQVIGGQETESHVGFLIRPAHWLESQPIENELLVPGL